MFLVSSEGGSLAVVIILTLISLLVFGFNLFFIIKYIVKVFKGDNIKAEKNIAYAGYSAILAMIVLFLVYYLFSTIELYHEIEEVTYYGLILLVAIIPVIILLLISDLKQISWMKGLSTSERETLNVGLKDRKPLVYVMIVLLLITTSLFGLNFEKFIIYLI